MNNLERPVIAIGLFFQWLILIVLNGVDTTMRH